MCPITGWSSSSKARIGCRRDAPSTWASGTGRNAIYLARHGWETVGVEMSGYAVEVARRKAAAQAVTGPIRSG